MYVLFGNEDSDLTRYFLLISHVAAWFRELVFRIAQGSDDLITVHKFETGEGW